ncbi:hypothetical protein C8Q78DRAFT_226597 [Trametes maxima]|nr:hypothetical protein C8Q78DRAFT_226597 [Trametes maxima]
MRHRGASQVTVLPRDVQWPQKHTCGNPGPYTRSSSRNLTDSKTYNPPSLIDCGSPEQSLLAVGNVLMIYLLLAPSLDPQARVYADTRSVSYSTVACTALLTWDVLITFSEEVDSIWRREWTAMTYVYIVVRYGPWMALLALLPLTVGGSTGLEFKPGQCEAWKYVQGVLLQTVLVMLANMLLYIYDHSDTAGICYLDHASSSTRGARLSRARN